MPANFDWHADDDKSWDEFKSSKKPPLPKASRGLRIALILSVAVILVAVGYLVFNKVSAVISETEISIETDILTSQDLVFHALSVGDTEVLVSVLSGREDEWTKAIISLLDDELLYDRSPYGLHWDRTVPPSNVEVTISPDHRSAEVNFTLAYSHGMGVGNALAEDTIDLTQSAIYRTSSDRWLLAPPLEEYWGNFVRSEGRYVTVNFPEKDAALSRRLAADLEATIGAACSSRLGFTCPDASLLNIVLMTEPSALVAFIDPYSRFDSSYELQLPAPTLLGLPADEDGYDAISRAYSKIAVQRLLNRMNEWDCCQNAVFYGALLDAELSELGIQDWPFTPLEYLSVLNQPVSVAGLADAWENSDALLDPEESTSAWQVYALVEFLLSEKISISPAEMQDALQGADNAYQWVDDVLQFDFSREYVEDAWNNYLLQRIDAYQVESPIPWPDQDIALICDDGMVGSSNLYVFDPDSETWTLALTNREFVHMSTVPNGQGIMLTDQLLRPERILTFLWRDGQEYAVDEGHRVFRLTGRTDPDGGVAAMSGYDSETFTSGHYLLNLENCGSRGCTYEPAPGSLRWSPNGQRTLFMDASLGQDIYVGDEVGGSAMYVGSGRDPLWLDDDVMGYIRMDVMPVVISATIGQGAEKVLFTREDAARVITETRPVDLVILRATTYSQEPNTLIVTAGNRAGNQTFVIAYDWKADEIKLIYEDVVASSALTAVGISPNGRWLLISTVPPNHSTALPMFNILLYDFQNDQLRQLMPANGTISPALGWSADGRWLLQNAEGRMVLTAVEEGYQHLVQHGLNACRGGAWTSSPSS